MPFSVFLLAYTVGMIAGGRLQDRYGPRRICLIGFLLFGGDYFFSGFASSLFYLFLIYGGVGGIGAGFAYVTLVATVVKWFPEKKDLWGDSDIRFRRGGVSLCPGGLYRCRFSYSFADQDKTR